MCTFDVLSVEEKCMGLECRRKGLEESCPLHVGRTGGRWIEMDWRTDVGLGRPDSWAEYIALHTNFNALHCIPLVLPISQYIALQTNLCRFCHYWTFNSLLHQPQMGSRCTKKDQIHNTVDRRVCLLQQMAKKKS